MLRPCITDTIGERAIQATAAGRCCAREGLPLLISNSDFVLVDHLPSPPTRVEEDQHDG
jgi:hypothetical protein